MEMFGIRKHIGKDKYQKDMGPPADFVYDPDGGSVHSGE
jgi:hypothetical protein